MASVVHPVTGERIARHGFVDRPARTVVEAAGLTTAIQAQDPLQSRLGLRSRSATITERDVLNAIASGDVVRTWLMRSTIHLVGAADARWLTRLLGPSIQRRFRTRWLDMGLTQRIRDATVDALPAILADGPLTRPEIVARLAEAGVSIPTKEDGAANHAMLYASALGLVCRGPERGRDSTFVLLEQWLPRAPAGPDGDEAVAELARRYFAAFSPATAIDFGAWSGLAYGAAIALIRDELEPVDVGGRPGYRLRDDARQEAVRGTVRLAAGFDNYLIGYRERSLLIAERHRSAVYVGGIIKPTVLVDGRIAGIWRLARGAKPARVTVTPLEALSVKTKQAVAAEVADISRFIGTPTELSFESS